MTEPYTSAAGVESAIRDAARQAFALDKTTSTQDRIRQEYFRRFLSRVFSEQKNSDWLLKGAAELMRSFIDPALRGEASGLTWSPEFLAWS